MSDRPFARKLIKLAARLTGPATAHRQDLWPGLAIDRTTGIVRWRGNVLLTLTPFSGIVPQNADSLAVVGSGPSLSGQRPELLPDGTAILLNGAATLADRVTPLAIAVEDERFVFRHFAMIAALPPSIPLFLSPAAMRAIAERGVDVLRNRPVALIENLAKPLGGRKRALTDASLDPYLLRGADGAALSIAPDHGVVIAGTVALSALQICLNADPRQIIIAGVDLTNANAAPRFYEDISDRAPSGIVTGLDRIMAVFALAKVRAASQKIELVCASPTSALRNIGIPYKAVLD